MLGHGYRHGALLGALLVLCGCSSSGDGGGATPVDDDPIAGPVAEGSGAGDGDNAGIADDPSTDDPPIDDQADDDPTADEPGGWFESYRSADASDACSAQDLKHWIDHDMRDYYVYADRVPLLDLDDYADEGELVQALRVPPDEFSGVSDAGEFVARYEEGVVVDFGFDWVYIDERVRFRRVDEGSPAGLAGLLRGDTLIAIDGVLEADLTADVYDDLYEMDEGETARFTVQTGELPARDLDIAMEAYVLDTLPLVQARRFEDGRNVGYLVVSTFLEPTDAQLNAAFDFFSEQGINELILDLRYNGGGRSRVANRLAARLGGQLVAGRVYSNVTRNENYARFSEIEPFEEVERSLALSRVVVLTTWRTASASENLINGLRPFLDITVIGHSTRGKPFSSQGIDYCERTASLMNAIVSNSAGVSVAGGIAPDCTVDDTVDFAIGDDRDALRAAALDYLADGTCPVAAAAKATPEDRLELPVGKAFRPMDLRY